MSKEIIHTNEAPHSIASYSQAVKAAGLVFVSGQGPFDVKTGEVVGATIQEQTAQCLRNIEVIHVRESTATGHAIIEHAARSSYIGVNPIECQKRPGRGSKCLI